MQTQTLDKKDARDQLIEVAEETLEFFEKTASYADSELAGSRPPTASAFAAVNTLTSETQVRNLASNWQQQQQELQQLRSEPAIARLVVLDEEGTSRVLYIARGSIPRLSADAPWVASYRSPLGRLAATRVGNECEVIAGQHLKSYEVAEKAALRPIRSADEWDSSDTVVERRNLVPVTIASLRAMLKQAEIPEDGDLVEQLLEDDRSASIVFEGRRRSIIEKMGLRDQPLLDEYQDAIFRLPIDSRLAILGPPGSGKTTTLIKRLGQKLDAEYLDKDELAKVARSVAGAAGHSTNWLMFTPTELLKLYVREAFARENIAASDERIQTWDDFRRELARQRLGILRTANGRGAVFREGMQNLRSSTIADQVRWFEDFDDWQTGDFWRELTSCAQVVVKESDPSVRQIGTRLLTHLQAAPKDGHTVAIVALQGLSELVSELIRDKQSSMEKLFRSALSRELKKDRSLLDSLLAFLETLKEGGDFVEDLDEQDAEEEVDVRAPKGNREDAFDAYKRAVRTRARALLSKRSVGRQTANGRVLEWLGDRVPSQQELEQLGQALRVLDALSRFANPLGSYLDRIPSRYRRFRRERQAGGRWYLETIFPATDLSPLEVDVVVLAVLRAGGRILQHSDFQGLEARPGLKTLAAIRDLFRGQIVVDEATDFSPIQLACMTQMCDPAMRSFLICGDFNQRLTIWGSRSVDELHWVFPDLKIHSIVVTYRHSRQLNEFATRLLALSGRVDSEARLPLHLVSDGFAPVLGTALVDAPLVSWLASRIKEIERITGALPSIAVLVNGEEEVDNLASALNDDLTNENIRCTPCPNGLVRGHENDVRVFDVRHIKGLEFEAVFFVGIDGLTDTYPDLFDKYLYVGATRAATYLGLTCSGPSLPSKLLPLADMFDVSWDRSHSIRQGINEAR